MSQATDFTKLSADQRRALLVERLKLHFNFPESEISTFSKRLFDHYENLKIFPKSASTLDVSVKALVRMWKSSKEVSARP